MSDITQIQVGSTTYDIRDTNVALKAPLASPALTGTPTAPTPSASDDSTRIATTAMVQDVAEGKEDLIIKSASGAVASFADGADYPVSELIVDIDPVQDLHGYDNPWPAGGGKNLLENIGITQTINDVKFTVNSDGSVSLSGTASSQTVFIINNNFSLTNGESYIASGVTGGANYTYFMYISGGVSSAAYCYSGDNSITATGSTITVAIYIRSGVNVNNVVIKPMIRPSSVSDATYAPYSNICPISGHTSAMVTRTGRNLWDYSAVRSVNGMTVTKNSDGTITVSGLPTINYVTLIDGYDFTDALEDGATYTLSINPQVQNVIYPQINAKKYDNSMTYYNTNGNNRTFTVDKSTYKEYKVYLITGTTANWGSDSRTVTFELQIEKGSSVSSFSPYQGTSVTIDLNGTRYGGSINVLTGEMTVDRAMVDMGTLSWETYSTAQTGKYRFGTGSLGTVIKKPSSFMVTGKLTCSILPEIKGDQPYSNVNGIGIHTNGNVLAYSDAYATMTYSQFTTAVTGQTLVYPLATPLTVQLTPAQLSTLLGENNIWASTGDISLKYWTNSDFSEYLNKRYAQKTLATTTTPGLILEAPLDSKKYIRENGTWIELSTIISVSEETLNITI